MTPWQEALGKLRSIGYSVNLDDGKLRYAYRGEGNPSRDEITPLLDVLKANKEEILYDPCFLIDQMLREINSAWEPGVLAWTKANRPDEWGKMLTLEGEINKIALCGDLNAFREVLDSYRGIILAMVEEFKSQSLKEKKGQGMFNFVESPKSPGADERWVK